MSRRTAVVLAAVLLAACGPTTPTTTAPTPSSSPTAAAAAEPLPDPTTDGARSLEDVLATRRSVREFGDAPLTRAQLGQLLWAAQGVTSAAGQRTAPSAGGLYPLEVHAVTADGLLHYDPDAHAVRTVDDRDLRADLAELAAGQTWIADAPAVLVVTGIEARTAAEYGDRAPRYVALEAGHAAQNVLLQAAALGLAATPVGAITDADARALLSLSDDHTVYELLPVGHPAG